MRSLISFIFLFAATVLSAQTQVLSSKTARVLEPTQVDSMWSQVGTPNLSSVNKSAKTAFLDGSELSRQQGIMRIVGLDGRYQVTFMSVQSLPAGAMVVFRMIAPSGAVIPLGGFFVPSEGTIWNSTLWDGPFSNYWPEGVTTFQALIVSNGEWSVISGSLVQWQNTNFGPLQRVDVSPDGSALFIRGFFNEDAVAVLGWDVVKLNFLGTLEKTGERLARIDLVNGYQQGQMVLTIGCGESSTQLVNVRRIVTTTPGLK